MDLFDMLNMLTILYNLSFDEPFQGYLNITKYEPFI